MIVQVTHIYPSTGTITIADAVMENGEACSFVGDPRAMEDLRSIIEYEGSEPEVSIEAWQLLG